MIPFVWKRNQFEATVVITSFTLKKSMGLDAIFHEILTELKEKKQQAKRTIVFCQTRKQCALIDRLFVVALGNGLYTSEGHEPQTRLVEMYHSGTPTSVKKTCYL